MSASEITSLQSLETEIRRLSLRVEELGALLGEVAARVCRRPDPTVITWREIARLLGIEGKSPTEAARRRIRRERERAAGVRLRLLRGGVHRQDFLAWLEALAARRPGQGELIREATKER